MRKHVRHGVLHGLLPIAYVAGGWYGGAKYDAPDRLIETIDGAFITAHGLAAPVFGWGADYIAGTTDDFVDEAAESGLDPGAGQENADGAPTRPLSDIPAAPEKILVAAADPGRAFTVPPKAQLVASHAVLSSHDIRLCLDTVSNAPRADAAGVVAKGNAIITVDGAALLVMPATNACLSSGFGDREGRRHRGVDYFTQTEGMALAAGDGVIIEAETRSDYGNMLVIDHGDGVFTRYAHLRRFDPGVVEGAAVAQGQALGPIGDTGATRVTHLHYEILTGDYDSRKKSFGLTAADPFLY